MSRRQKLKTDSLRLIVESGGVDFRNSSSSYVFTCPRCNKSDLLAISKESGYWCCYKCKESGFKGRWVEELLSELYGGSPNDYKNKLYGEEIPQFSEKFELNLPGLWSDEMSPDPFNGWDLVPVYFPKSFIGHKDPDFALGRKYLLGRGLNEEIIQHYDLRYAPYRDSVVFPIKYESSYYGWQQRSCNSPMKSTMKGLIRSRCLMFYDNLDVSEHAILCEGPMDALKLHYQGGAVAALGKEITDYQLDLIKDKVKTVYLALDPDAAETTNRICKELTGTVDVRIMTPPNGKKDFGECSFEECQQAFQEAKSYSGQFSLNLKGFYGR